MISAFCVWFVVIVQTRISSSMLKSNNQELARAAHTVATFLVSQLGNSQSVDGPFKDNMASCIFFEEILNTTSISTLLQALYSSFHVAVRSTGKQQNEIYQSWVNLHHSFGSYLASNSAFDDASIQKLLSSPKGMALELNAPLHGVIWYKCGALHAMTSAVGSLNGLQATFWDAASSVCPETSVLFSWTCAHGVGHGLAIAAIDKQHRYGVCRDVRQDSRVFKEEMKDDAIHGCSLGADTFEQMLCESGVFHSFRNYGDHTIAYHTTADAPSLIQVASSVCTDDLPTRALRMCYFNFVNKKVSIHACEAELASQHVASCAFGIAFSQSWKTLGTFPDAMHDWDGGWSAGLLDMCGPHVSNPLVVHSCLYGGLLGTGILTAYFPGIPQFAIGSQCKDLIEWVDRKQLNLSRNDLNQSCMFMSYVQFTRFHVLSNFGLEIWQTAEAQYS